MYKKITFSFFAFLFFTINLQAQLWVDKMQNPNENFYSIQQEFKTYWQTKPYERGKGFKAFKRWEWFTEPRVYPSGDLKLASRAKAYEEFQNYLDANPTAAQRINSTNATTSTGNWTALGPFGSPIGGDGQQFVRRFSALTSTPRQYR